MWQSAPSATLLALILAASLPASCGATRVAGATALKAGRAQHKSLRLADRPADEGVVRPFQFNQSLLVCNAYPSGSPMLVRKNGQEILQGNRPIAFRECRYVSTRVQPHDKLDLMIRDVEIHGTFEVGDLPATDAVLLLVLERRAASPLVSFKSFAFPTNSDSKDAQLAVIDAFKGNSSAPHLKMEDHISGKEEQTVSKRVEQLNFDRVYSVEEGTYDASVADRHRAGDAAAEAQLESSTKKVLRLLKNQNYVVLRTGDGSEFGESLMVFPDIVPSGSRHAASAYLAIAIAVLARVFA